MPVGGPRGRCAQGAGGGSVGGSPALGVTCPVLPCAVTGAMGPGLRLRGSACPSARPPPVLVCSAWPHSVRSPHRQLRVPDPSPAEPLRGPDRAARARRAGPGEAAGARRARREEPLAGLCEIHVLPLVVAAQDPRRPQRLHCVELQGLSPCPQPLAARRQPRPRGRSLRAGREHAPMPPAAAALPQILPHVPDLPPRRAHLRRLAGTDHLPPPRPQPGALRQEHIEAFFVGDGQAPGQGAALGPRGRGGGRRLAEKRQIRSHLALGCRGQLCTDSLALYLNSSGRRDGTMLLWASKENGSGPGAALREPGPPGSPGGGRPQGALPCGRAPGGPGGLQRPQRRYPGPLARQLLASGQHGNMVLLSGQLGSDVARGSAFSEFWARPQPDQCLLQDLGQAGPRAAGSSPGATLQLLNVTLAGAPCHSTPPRTEDKHRRVFLGCQNLPTRLCCQATHTPQQDDA
ncbi:unnamed protein product [Caretta caretta]